MHACERLMIKSKFSIFKFRYPDYYFYSTMEHEVKTLAIKEIIQLAQKNPANNRRNIENFLKQISEKSNYLIEHFLIGNSRVAEPISYRQSTQTFAMHISLDRLHDHCRLILSATQFETLTSFQV